MRWCFLVAGQAAEEPGMGRALLEDPDAAEVIARASDELSLDVPLLLRRGGPQLDRTEVAQTVAVALAAAAIAGLRTRGVHPTLAAGHSLGELGAWIATGGPSSGDGVALAAARGRLLADQATRTPGGLLALTVATGFRASQREEVLADAAALGLALAADNALVELVLSGPFEGLEALRARHGGRMVLGVGPWHHPVMAPVVPRWRAALDGVVADDAVGFVSSVTTELVAAEGIREHLATAVVRTVRWRQTLARLPALGVDAVVLPGLSRTMRGLLRLNEFPLPVFSGTTPRELDAIAALGSSGAC
ncbi:MAG: ACP S-malonyltransferase [Alphaproteobacteria bacterium]|nr:ACP S-malonyltransferase [Alphaproteobacteria bacterium]